MVKITRVFQTPTFKKAMKKLHKNQKADLDKAVKDLIENPLSCEQKKGGLAFFVSINSKWLNSLLSLVMVSLS